MKKLLVVVAVALLFTPVAYAEQALQAGAEPVAQETAQVAEKYFCPMDGFESDKPGKCEKCGMDLVEKVATTEEAASEVTETAAEAPKA